MLLKLTTPFEKELFTFFFYVPFEESISYRVYSRVKNLEKYFVMKIVTLMTS